MNDLLGVVACLRIIIAAECKQLSSNDTLIKVLRECADRLESYERGESEPEPVDYAAHYRELDAHLAHIKNVARHQGKIHAVKEARAMWGCSHR